jgi:hypothetical protein
MALGALAKDAEKPPPQIILINIPIIKRHIAFPLTPVFETVKKLSHKYRF